MPITMFTESLLTQISTGTWREDELDLSLKLEGSGESNHLTIENIRSLVAVINKNNTRIRKLIFRNQRLDDECVNELANIANPSLVALDLYDNDITILSTQSLANNKNFKWLSLMGNGLGDVAITPFTHNRTLIYLNLSMNNISDEGGKLLIEADTALEELDIGCSENENKIGQETIKALAKNSKIKRLGLLGLYLGDKNIIFLLENNTRLTELDLSYNGLTDAITPSLLKHRSLTAVDLSYNDGITRVTAEKIYENLGGMPLIKLNLNCTDISSAWQKHLLELLADKRKNLFDKGASINKKRTVSEDSQFGYDSQESSQNMNLDVSNNEKLHLNSVSTGDKSESSASEVPESKKPRLSESDVISSSFNQSRDSSDGQLSPSSLSTARPTSDTSSASNSPSLMSLSVFSKENSSSLSAADAIQPGVLNTNQRFTK